MPLDFSGPPSEVDGAIERGLRTLAPTLNPEAAQSAAIAGTPMTLGIRDHHRVYFLALDDLAGGADLEAAELVGWRALIDDGKTLLAGAQVPAEGHSASFDRSPDDARQLESAFAIAEELKFVKEHKVEPRLLSVPSLYTAALWLYSLDSQDSLLMLLALDGETVDVPLTWTETEFLDHLRSRARRLELMDDSAPA